MVEIALGADRLAGFDHGHGGLAPGPAGFLEQDLIVMCYSALNYGPGSALTRRPG